MTFGTTGRPTVGGMGGQTWRSRIPEVELPPAFVDEEALREAVTGRRHHLRPAPRRLAAGLAEQGLGRGDVVSIVAANRVDYPVALYGALGTGAAVASANPALTANELARQF